MTLEDVKQLVLDNVQFQVQDSKTGQDLTRNILLQIIAEQEGESAGMLTNQVLQQLIRFYGDSMQGIMRQYLEQSIGTFLEQQDRLREQMESMIDATNPLHMMSNIAGQNMAMWNMFTGAEDVAKEDATRKASDSQDKPQPNSPSEPDDKDSPDKSK